MPNGMPALWQASAALRNVSSVQLSAFGGAPAGYIACTSMPACCFIRSMREHGPLIWLPMVAGTATHWPSGAAEILDRLVDGAVLLDQRRHDVVDRLEALRRGRPAARSGTP